MGYQRCAEGQLDSALLHYRNAVELDSSNALAIFQLGIVYYLKGDLDRAIRTLSRANGQEDYAEAYFFLGRICDKREEYVKSIIHYNKAINKQREYNDDDLPGVEYEDRFAVRNAYLWRARAHRKLEENAEAIEGFRMAKQLGCVLDEDESEFIGDMVATDLSDDGLASDFNELRQQVPENIVQIAVGLECGGVKYVYKDGRYPDNFPVASIWSKDHYEPTRFGNKASYEACKVRLGQDWVAFYSSTKTPLQVKSQIRQYEKQLKENSVGDDVVVEGPFEEEAVEQDLEVAPAEEDDPYDNLFGSGKAVSDPVESASPTAKVIAAMLTDPQVQVGEVQLAAMEGRHYLAEAKFRRRNRALIEEKKRQSDGKCSVCRFDFKTTYKGLDREFLVGHHVGPIGKRKKATKTTLAEIDILCPNCHAAVHSQDPPLSADELRGKLNS